MTYDDAHHLSAKIKPKQQKVRWQSKAVMCRNTNAFICKSYGNPFKHSSDFLHFCAQVELEVAMDTMGANYCRSKGEQIALNVDGTSCEESNLYSVWVRWMLP